MILTGAEIVAEHVRGRIKIEPFSDAQVSPNSYDFLLGPTLKKYKNYVLDCRRENFTIDISIPKDGYLLEPGRIYLGHTWETMGSDHYVPIIRGRSSTARLGLFVHVTADMIDIGSHNQWTLQLHAVQPVRVSLGLFHPTTSVDPGFTGPLTVTIINLGKTGYAIRRGERIAKMITSPVSPIPERIYGQGQKPRVTEGSIEHSLVVTKVSTPEGELEEEDFFGGPLGKLAERVRALEDGAELHRTSKENRRLRFVLLAIWTLIIAITGGTITKHGDVIWKWIKDHIGIP